MAAEAVEGTAAVQAAGQAVEVADTAAEPARRAVRAELAGAPQPVLPPGARPRQPAMVARVAVIVPVGKKQRS